MANKKLCVVEWIDPPHTGKRQTVETRCVVLGKCEPGSAVKVKLGKSSSAKKGNGIYIGTIEEVETAAQSAAKETAQCS